MPIITPILGELDHEAATTARMLERVPSDRLEWMPHPKSMTLRRLAWHLANIPAIAQTWLRDGTVERGAVRPAEAPETVPEIVEAFHRNVASLREYLATLDDATLKETFTMTRNGATVMSFPKIAVVRNVLLNHSYHHRGQLSVYLRLLDVPVPAVYGPSADELM